MRADPLFILAVLSFIIFLSEWLVRRTMLSHVGSALMVIVLGAIAANAGVIPAGSRPTAPVPVYDVVFSHVAPIALFWLLLPVNLRSLLKAGPRLIALFLVGSLATMIGAVLAIHVVRGAESIGSDYGAIAGMFAATYIGGSVNFNAIALHYGVMQKGVLYAGSVVVDNIVTTTWIMATLAIPRVFSALWSRRVTTTNVAAVAPPITELAAETEAVHPRALALLLAFGVGAQWLSLLLARAFATAGVAVPPILIITTMALVLAQIPPVSRLPGARAAGMYAVYLFLTVIGAFCDVRAMGGLGRLGLILLAFAALLVATHGLITFAAAWLFRIDLAGAAVASQANIGGSTSALALAKSLGREDLLVPGILLGSLGNAIGTFLGFLVVSFSS